MKSHFYHAQINVDLSKNRQFYKDLMAFLGWSVIFESEGMVGKYNGLVGFKSGASGDLWFVDSTDKEISSYDKIGVNHISIRVDKQEDINETIKFLDLEGIKPIYNTPRHRPEFASTEDETYYQIIFETPDKIQFEIVYIGPKSIE